MHRALSQKILLDLRVSACETCNIVSEVAELSLRDRLHYFKMSQISTLLKE